MMIVLAQLCAVRAQVDTAIGLIESRLRPPTPKGCQHVREVNASTFGAPPKKVCLDCGAERPGTVA